MKGTTLALVVVLAACKKPDPGPDLQIVGEMLRLRSGRSGDAVPKSSPWFDGQRLAVTGARGETLGFQVLHRGGGAVTLELPAARVTPYEVRRVQVRRGSTDMYGGSHGTGAYPDELVAKAAPATDPAYFEITIPRELAPGKYAGKIAVAGRAFPIELTVAPVTLPPLPLGVWAEYNPVEVGGTAAAPSVRERACIAMFRDHGVLLAPPVDSAAWAARTELEAGAPFVPVDLPRDPTAAAAEVKAWIAQTQGTGHVPFAIPIDEPNAAARPKVRALAQVVRDAGGGPGRFLFAVTDEPRVEYGGLIDLYVTLKPHLADAHPRWTYNGAPPRAGSMVVDAEPPGTRTWGWIGWRYQIPIWYAWDALYWHDRHNRKDQPPHALETATDAISFDDGDDRGNLDGVLALPGDEQAPCRPTLRLATIRRGLEDRALLDLASACDPAATKALATELVPRALGDAEGAPSWPVDEAAWEAARQRLLGLAACQR